MNDGDDLNEARKLLIPPVKLSDEEPDPMQDIRDLIRGLEDKSKRTIEFYCGTHGFRMIDKVVLAGVQLKCGCRLTNIGDKWVFSTYREREGME